MNSMKTFLSLWARIQIFMLLNITVIKVQNCQCFSINIAYPLGSRGLVDRALDLKPEVTQGCGFDSRLQQQVHDCSPGAAQSAAHCSKCVHLDGLNAENTFHSSLYSV